MTAQTAPQHDNLLGICHSLGETFGFNPLYLRLAFLVGLLITPSGTAMAYAVAGMAVLIAKMLTRSTKVSIPAIKPPEQDLRSIDQRIAASRLRIETNANATELSATP